MPTVLLSHPSGSSADVYLNGTLKGTINFYASTTRNRRVLFVLNGVGGQNVVELRWRRAHSAGSTGYRLNLDGFNLPALNEKL